MGKGKKGKKGGGKKKGGKGKKDKEPEMTPNEAILAYRINLKEKQLEDIRFEIKTLSDKHERDKDRNLRLSEERAAYMKMLMKQARSMDMKGEDFVDKKEVIVAMKHNWEVEKEERQGIKELQKDIVRMDKKINAVQREVDYWNSYKDKGQFDHKTQIEIGNQDLIDMQHNYDAMSNYIEARLFKDKEEIENNTNAAIDRQKDLASNKAINSLDNSSKQEVSDNEWLKNEFKIHQREMLSILRIVEELEKENLEIMSELFECKVQDLKISKDFFITQFSDNDNLEDHGILDVDLKKIFPESDKKTFSTQDLMLQKYEKILQRYSAHEVEDLSKANIIEDDEEIIAANDDDDEDDDETVSDDDDQFNFDTQLGWNDCLDIGPLELKMLHVEGKKMVLHQPYIPSAEEAEAQQWNPDVWPVNKSMLNKVQAADDP